LNIFGHLLRQIGAARHQSMLIAFALSVLLVAGNSLLAPADSCVQLNSTTYTQNFNTLPATGTSNNVLTLPIGFTFSETGSGNNASYTASDGSSPSGDTYSFGTGTNTDRAFGELTSGTVQSTVGACFIINTGSAIMTALVGYTGEQWRLGTTGGVVDRLDFQFSTDATSITSSGTWMNVDGLDFTTPNNVAAPGALDGNAAGNRMVFAPTSLNPATPIAANATFYMRWLPSNITGANDGLAIDDFLLGFVPPPGLSGDFNSNNEVDAGDYLIWRKKFGAGTLPNDAGVSPGNIDAADYTHWRKRFGISAIPSGGSGSGSDLGSADVPEPASGFFLMAGGCMLALAVRLGRILPEAESRILTRL
jgi:hypothetical protein